MPELAGALHLLPLSSWIWRGDPSGGQNARV